MSGNELTREYKTLKKDLISKLAPLHKLLGEHRFQEMTLKNLTIFRDGTEEVDINISPDDLLALSDITTEELLSQEVLGSRNDFIGHCQVQSNGGGKFVITLEDGVTCFNYDEDKIKVPKESIKYLKSLAGYMKDGDVLDYFLINRMLYLTARSDEMLVQPNPDGLFYTKHELENMLKDPERVTIAIRDSDWNSRTISLKRHDLTGKLSSLD